MSDTTANPRRPFVPAGAALWASAAIIAALIIVQAGRLTGGTPAFGDLAISNTDYAVLTSDAGSDDMVVVLDQRSESLLIYHVRNQSTLDFKVIHNIKDMFVNARVAGNPGGK